MHSTWARAPAGAPNKDQGQAKEVERTVPDPSTAAAAAACMA
jgi:hypothetical protein